VNPGSLNQSISTCQKFGGNENLDIKETVSLLLPVFLVLTVVTVVAPAQSVPTDPKEIIDRVDRLMRGDSSHGVAEMSIVTDRWQRTKTLEIWSEGTETALIRILEPRKEAGVATLKVGSDIWNYLPKIDRTIRVPTSMMMASWMGSHFTNDDLVKESRLITDYEIEIAFEGEKDGMTVYEFTLFPYPDAPVVWGRIDYRVRKDNLMPLWAKYFDEEGALKRTMVFSDFQEMGGRLVPAKMTLTPEDKPGEQTVIVYSKLEFDIKLPDNTFSLASLRKRR
jgi:outer membrane lipoprotein-sorting protein